MSWSDSLFRRNMERLSKSLRAALRRAIGTDCDLRKLGEGLTEQQFNRLVVDLDTLKDMGFITADEINGEPRLFVTAKGLDYRRERAATIIGTVGRYAFQFLVGIAGGALAAWIALMATS